MIAEFNESTELFYKRTQETYPDLIDLCNSLFPTNIKKLEKYLSALCNDTEEFINVVIDFAPEDPADLTKFVISKLEKHITVTTEPKKKLRDALRIKKKYYRQLADNKKINFTFMNALSEEACLNWLNDVTKLNLTEFAFFNELSDKIKFQSTLLFLEYILCDSVDEELFYQFPMKDSNSLWLLDYRFTTPPMASVNENGRFNFYHDVILSETEDEVKVKRYFIADDVNLPCSNNAPKEELAVFCENYKNYCTPIYANKEVFDVVFHIINMLNFDWCEKGYIIYKIDDLISRMDPSIEQIKNESYRYKKKNELKEKIIEILGSMYKYRTLTYSINKKFGTENIKEQLNGSEFLQDSVWVDKKKTILKTTLSDNVINKWINNMNEKVLKTDIEKTKKIVPKALLFYIQGFRVNSRNSNYMASISINAFKSTLGSLLSDKQFVITLLSYLDKLKDENIQIYSFKKEGSLISFQFIPLNEYELDIYNIKPIEI